MVRVERYWAYRWYRGRSLIRPAFKLLGLKQCEDIIVRMLLPGPSTQSKHTEKIALSHKVQGRCHQCPAPASNGPGRHVKWRHSPNQEAPFAMNACRHQGLIHPYGAYLVEGRFPSRSRAAWSVGDAGQ